MRLKQTDIHPLSVVQHNGNENLLSDSTTTTSTEQYTTNNRNNIQQYNNQQQQLNNLHNVVVFNNSTTDSVQRRQDTLQWCNTINSIQHQQRDNSNSLVSQEHVDRAAQVRSKQHQQQNQQKRAVFNINNTLAASLPVSVSLANSRCDELSPDDSLLDYEEAQQSCSSVDTSPQDEDRGFDLSDSESLSDDGNLSGEHHVQPRGIVNPNYPGFQHLAHTLDYTIKVCSDTDFTDDDLDLDTNTCDVNNINNNNNNEEEYKIDSIDSVNRLDSVENIQKVFYDKPKLNIPLEFESEKRNNCDSTEEATGSNIGSDEDLEGNILSDQDLSDSKLNITESFSSIDIVGDLGKEIECELGRIVAREIEQDLEEAVEKLNVTNDLSPTALTYNIEPNSDEPFEKVQIQTVQILESIIVKQEAPEVSTPQINEEIINNSIVAALEYNTEANSNEPDEKDQIIKVKSLESAIIKPEISPVQLSEEFQDNIEANDLKSNALECNIEAESDKPIEKDQNQPIRISKFIEQEVSFPIQLKKEITKTEEATNEFVPIALKSNIETNPNESTGKDQAEKVIGKDLELTEKQNKDLLDPKLETKKSIQTKENFVGFRPELVKEMADIKVAKVTSTGALTLKLNQSFSQSKMRPETIKTKTTDAFLSETRDTLPEFITLEKQIHEIPPPQEKMEINTRNTKIRRDSNRETEESTKMETDETEKFCKEDKTKDDFEKDEDSTVPRKKEKMEINYVKKRRDTSQQIGSLITIPRRELGGRNRDNLANRRSVPAARDKKKASPEILGGFDVYNIETAMPKIDLDAIENHLRAAREEERRRRTDREEIRRRLAMGCEDDYYSGCDRPGRKPSLQARLQSGMNLQICFMNETASDTESPNSDTECSLAEPKHSSLSVKPQFKAPQRENKSSIQPRPVSLPLGLTQPLLQPITQPMTEADFFARQARLQTEARMALAQAKEMAHMQMEVERQRQKKSPITEMIRSSLEKVGIPFPEERRRVSRQILTEMNVAQLQVIVNDLHTQIETLNENLVRYLMNRDDLHMEQDSMLVDIEDLTRYLGAKEQTVKDQKLSSQNNNIPPPSPAPASPLAAINNSVKPRLHRIASLVKK